MDEVGLKHYFTMHGANVERKAGRPGRGKFGTGKSAAFGIANSLQLDTVRNGIRNVVRLTREQIDASNGEEVPIDWHVEGEQTDRPNGTIVTISDLLLQRVDTASVIEYIERHLPYFRGLTPKVAVNNHVCEYREPRIVQSNTFEPSDLQRSILGNVFLTIKVAQAPLPEAEQGVAITAGSGNLVAIERGGIERKEFAAYLFGDVDVLTLEDPNIPIAPYDASRNLQLNPKHPVVAALVGFIGSKLEAVRSELVAEERVARQSEEARRLALEADRIADILNQDFSDQVQKLREIRAATTRPAAGAAVFGSSSETGSEDDVWIAGIEQPGNLPQAPGRGREGRGSGRPDPKVIAVGEKDPEGSDLVSPAGGSGSGRHRPKGGFTVEYKNLGADEDRSEYVAQTMTILINLDHPVMNAALGNGGIEDPGFRRLSYEVAFGEYAFALGYEMANYDPDIPADDLLFEVRRTVNRVARSSAELYKSDLRPAERAR